MNYVEKVRQLSESNEDTIIVRSKYPLLRRLRLGMKGVLLIMEKTEIWEIQFAEISLFTSDRASSVYQIFINKNDGSLTTESQDSTHSWLQSYYLYQPKQKDQEDISSVVEKVLSMIDLAYSQYIRKAA